MAAGLGAYRQLFRDPRARAFSLAGLVARLPLSMTGIGVVLLISLTSGSFGRAGVVTAAGTLTGAAVAPFWGRLIDRVGQARVLLAAAVANSLGMALLISAVLGHWPLAVSLAAAVLAGLGFSSAGACVRARWSHRLGESPTLQTAFAVEAVLDEVVFITGPVLVTFLATTFHPALGVGVSAVIGLVGAVLLAVQRSTQPPVVHRDHRTPRVPLDLRILLPVGIACAALGAIFGGMEVVVVAFAKEHAIVPYAGAFITVWATGSLVSGVVTGTVTWKASAATRFRTGALVLALTLVPLPFLTNPWLVVAMLLISGMAIAPTLIASIAVIQAAVPQARLTEALGWNSTGLAVGLATGAAVSGILVDGYASRGGFLGVVAAGVLLVLGSLFVRARRVDDVSPEPPGTPAAEPSRRSAGTPST